jgi:UDPglucose 6-dehydrogenase
MTPTPVQSICCLGAGYFGGPTMAMIAAKCPHLQVTFADFSESRIAAWNSPDLPVYEIGLDEVVASAIGRNLHFTADSRAAIAAADLIFICVGTTTKSYGVGASRAVDLPHLQSAARLIAEVSQGHKIVVEKSSLPVKTATVIKSILAPRSPHAATFEVISNPEFLAEGTAIADMASPHRILIGGETTPEGAAAVEALAGIYANWIPRDRIVTTKIWSS